jgi:hypothetical protein
MLKSPTLTPALARRIIQALGSSGTPPEEGAHFYTVGLDRYLQALDNEYLASYLADGNSIFKMVVGPYGAGKTHFLYSLRDQARSRHYAVSYVTLKRNESPFHELHKVYKTIADGLLTPYQSDDGQPAEQGIGSFLRAWYARQYLTLEQEGFSTARISELLNEQINGLEIAYPSYRSAVQAALRAYHQGNETLFTLTTQWLRGEVTATPELKKLRISDKLDKATAFKFLSSLSRTVRALGYTGLVILLDEAEISSGLTVRNREALLSNLRELIDECGRSAFSAVMLVYAVPNTDFLNGREGVYEALNQRLESRFSPVNPSGVKVMLEKTVGDRQSFLVELGSKISNIYRVAYQTGLDPVELTVTIGRCVQLAEETEYAAEGYKRLFVQRMIKALRLLQAEGTAPSAEQIVGDDA